MSVDDGQPRTAQHRVERYRAQQAPVTTPTGDRPRLLSAKHEVKPAPDRAAHVQLRVRTSTLLNSGTFTSERHFVKSGTRPARSCYGRSWWFGRLRDSARRFAAVGHTQDRRTQNPVRHTDTTRYRSFEARPRRVPTGTPVLHRQHSTHKSLVTTAAFPPPASTCPHLWIIMWTHDTGEVLRHDDLPRPDASGQG